MSREMRDGGPQPQIQTHFVTESSGERTIALMKDTDGVLEDFVTISSLACVANGSSDDGRPTENSRPKSCETEFSEVRPSSDEPFATQAKE